MSKKEIKKKKCSTCNNTEDIQRGENQDQCVYCAIPF